LGLWGNYGLTHDQIAAGNASHGLELLVKNKELKSNYNYSLGGGLYFTAWFIFKITSSTCFPYGLNYSLNFLNGR